jgi:deoxycytidylate deaminase
MNIAKLINAALNASEKSRITEWSIGAVLVKGSKIISTGYNKNSGKMMSLRKQGYRIWSLHAEMVCMLGNNCEGGYLFVAGFKTKNKNPINSKPCKECVKMAKEVGIRGIFYLNKTIIEYLEI